MTHPELAYFISDTEAQYHIAVLSSEILDAHGLFPQTYSPPRRKALATMLLPYSTVRPAHLIKLAWSLNYHSPANYLSILQQDFITIDAADSHAYHLRPGTAFQYQERVKANPDMEWELFDKFSDYNPHSCPKVDLIALGYGIDYLSDAKLASFSHYLPDLLNKDGLVAAITHSISPLNPFAKTLQKRKSQNHGVPIPVYPRSLSETLKLTSPLKILTASMSGTSNALLFGRN